MVDEGFARLRAVLGAAIASTTSPDLGAAYAEALARLTRAEADLGLAVAVFRHSTR